MPHEIAILGRCLASNETADRARSDSESVLCGHPEALTWKNDLAQPSCLGAAGNGELHYPTSSERWSRAEHAPRYFLNT